MTIAHRMFPRRCDDLYLMLYREPPRISSRSLAMAAARKVRAHTKHAILGLRIRRTATAFCRCYANLSILL
jgi:hypothetical protein